MGKKPEIEVYVDSLSHLSEGHALWHKVLSDDLRPGTCGYFDGYGAWVPLLHLTDPNAVSALEEGLVAPVGLGVKNDGGMTSWRQRLSYKMRGIAVDLDGEALPPGAPATAKAGVQYTSEAKRGAILLGNPPITHEWLTNPKTALTWMETNLNKVLSKAETRCINKRGLWLVKSTYHAPICAKTVMQEKNQTAGFHVGTSVPDVAKATASVQWWAADHSSSEWIVHGGRPRAPAPQQGLLTDGSTNTEIQGLQPGQIDEVVMLFGGYWWKPSGVFSTSHKLEDDKTKQSYLGGEEDEEDCVWVPSGEADDEKAYLKLVVGTVGEGDGRQQDPSVLPKHDGKKELYAYDET